MGWKPQRRDDIKPRLPLGPGATECPCLHELIYGDAERYDREKTGSITISFQPGEALVTIVSRHHQCKGHRKMVSGQLDTLLQDLEAWVQNNSIDFVELTTYPRS